MITLSDGTTTVTLPADLSWSDESWEPVEQTVQRSVTGALIVSTATRIKGRSITLQPLDDSSSWIARSALDQLRNWGAVPGKTLVLTLREVQYNVIFRHHDSPAVDAKPVVHYDNVVQTDWYLVTLKFTEI